MKKRKYEMREEKYVNSFNYISKCYVKSIRINRSNLMKNEEMTEQLSTNRSGLG